jgi:hypothetical protein
MTTCFSHFVRGDLQAAARANPAGILLAAACVLLIPWCLLSAANGCLWLVDRPTDTLSVVIGVLGGFVILWWLLAMWRAG